MNIEEIRQQYPEYDDLSDDQLLKGIHSKSYSDMTYDDFVTKVSPTESPDPSQLPERPTSGIDKLREYRDRLASYVDGSADVATTIGSSMVAEPLAGIAGLSGYPVDANPQMTPQQRLANFKSGGQLFRQQTIDERVNAVNATDRKSVV